MTGIKINRVRPDAYHAYEDEYDGGSEIGYFWNEYDAFIACLKWHKKDLDNISLCIQQEKERGRTEIWKGYWKERKKSKIKRLRKLRIEKIIIK